LTFKVGKADACKLYVLAEDLAGYGSPCWAQHGLSILLEVESQGETTRILFDTGTYHEPVMFNARLLAVKPEEADIIVLSHAHYDHTGGLAGILKARGGREIPIIAHPAIFRQCFITKPRFRLIGLIGENTRGNVEKLGGRWTLSKEPVQLAPGVTTTGEVERVTEFEREVTLESYYVDEKGVIVRDQIVDDLSLALNVGGQLVVVTGCSHAGIINILKKAVEVSGCGEIEAVVGGLHLMEASRERIKKTIDDLKRMGVKKVYAGHCTGFEAERLLTEDFRENFVRLHAGLMLSFSR